MSGVPQLAVLVHDARIEEFPGSTPGTTAGWLRQADGAILIRSDPAGTRPLCWRIINRTLNLGCYPAQLARLSPQLALDLPTLANLAGFTFPDDGASIFAGVRRVIAGMETRIAPSGSFAEERWWTLPAEASRAGERPALWPALVAECRRMLRGRKVAILLSGGLDSSTIAAAVSAAAREAGWPLPVLASIVYPGLGCDETPWQESVGRHLGLTRVAINPVGTPVWNAARQVIRERLTPMADTQSGAIGHLVEAARQQGCESIFTGFGGDVLFRGVGLELSLARRGRLYAAHRHLSGLSDAMPLSTARLWYAGVVRPLIRGIRTGPLTREAVDRAGSSVRSVVIHALQSSGLGWIIEGVEQAPATSATLESPFYGAAFLEQFGNLTQEDFARARTHKGILREMVRPHLPPDVVDRIRKSNFLEYHRTWLARERMGMAARYRELRPEAPSDWNLAPDISNELEAESGRHGFSKSWMMLAALEVLNAARATR